MRTVELKSISLASSFRLFGGAGVLIGVVSCVFLSLEGDLKIPAMVLSLPFVESAQGVVRDVFLGTMSGVFYGVIGGLACVVMTAVYNFFSSLFGGVDITLDEH